MQVTWLSEWVREVKCVNMDDNHIHIIGWMSAGCIWEAERLFSCMISRHVHVAARMCYACIQWTLRVKTATTQSWQNPWKVRIKGLFFLLFKNFWNTGSTVKKCCLECIKYLQWINCCYSIVFPIKMLHLECYFSLNCQSMLCVAGELQ